MFKRTTLDESDMTANNPLPSPLQWDHEQAFDHFLEERSKDSYDPLSVAAARPYRSIWRSWCKFLSSKQTAGIFTRWDQARPEELVNFLFNGGMTPAGNRRTTLSDISRRRYWTVINSVYVFAKENGQIVLNPADGLMPEDIPLLVQSEGQIFNERDWKAIERAIPIECTTSIETRNRALILLIMDTAMTTSEIARLQTNDLTLLEKGVFTITINGSRHAQFRTLELSDQTTKAMSDWLAARPKMKIRGPKNGTLFTTQKRGPIRPPGIYHIVDQTVRAALAEGAALPSHTGAQRLRNTRIVHWLNSGLDAVKVHRMAGFKDERSFRGLVRHINGARSIPSMTLDRSKSPCVTPDDLPVLG